MHVFWEKMKCVIYSLNLAIVPRWPHLSSAVTLLGQTQTQEVSFVLAPLLIHERKQLVQKL